MKEHSRPIYGIVLHETQSPIGDVIEKRDAIRDGHTRRGWDDIGYHAVVNPETGEWATGRPFMFRGSHVARMNNGLIGIGILGYWSHQKGRALPYSAVLGVLAAVVAAIKEVDIDGDCKFYTHNELSKTYTDCGKGPIQQLVNELNSKGLIEWV